MTEAEATAYGRLKRKKRDLWWRVANLSVIPSFYALLIAFIVDLQPADDPLIERSALTNSRAFYNASAPTWAGIVLSFTLSLLVASAVSLRDPRGLRRASAGATITDTEGRAVHVDDIDAIDLRHQLVNVVGVVLPLAHVALTVLAIAWTWAPSMSADYSPAEVNIRLGVSWAFLLMGSVTAALMHQSDTLRTIRWKGERAELIEALRRHHGLDASDAPEKESTAPRVSLRYIASLALAQGLIALLLFWLVDQVWQQSIPLLIALCGLGLMLWVLGLGLAFLLDAALGARHGDVLLYQQRQHLPTTARSVRIPGAYPVISRAASAHLHWLHSALVAFMLSYSALSHNADSWSIVPLVLFAVGSLPAYRVISGALLRRQNDGNRSSENHSTLIFRRGVPVGAIIAARNEYNTQVLLIGSRTGSTTPEN